MRRRIINWALILIVVIAAGALLAAFLADEPLRRKMEAQLNDTIKGYTIEIGKLDLHPLGFSVDIENTIVRQEAYPEPAIAEIPTMTASIDWRALLSGSLVAYIAVEDPKFFVNLRQLEREQKDEESLKDKGWQRAVQEISPLEINSMVVRNASLTYVDKKDFRPLNMHSINFWATNIRNVRSEEGQYPSAFHLDAGVFEKGAIVLDGHADFLAEPHVSFRTSLDCRNLELDYLQPIAQRYNLSIRKGVLQTAGQLEYTPTKQIIEIGTLTLDNLDAEYVHTNATSPTGELSKKTDKVIKEKSNDPVLSVDFDEIVVNQGKLGVVNKSSKPEYRVFVSEAEINVKNLSNQSEEGIASATLTGQFMGSGPIKALARFRPRSKAADFDLNLQIEEAELQRMNDLLRAASGVDVTSGIFSFYSEVSVRSGTVKGYVKPLFRDVNVYSPAQDKRKNVFQKLYEGIVDGLAWVLENRPREEVATRTDISGTLSDPQTSTLDVLLGLIQNAFFKGILPGLERSVQTSRR
jgi:hypothetical protein